MHVHTHVHPAETHACAWSHVQVYDMNTATPSASAVFANFSASLCGLLKSPSINFPMHAEYIEALRTCTPRTYARARASPHVYGMCAWHVLYRYIEAHFVRHHRNASSSRAAAFNVALYSDADGSHLTNDYAAALAVECQV